MSEPGTQSEIFLGNSCNILKSDCLLAVCYYLTLHFVVAALLLRAVN